MASNVRVFIASSLDGFIAGENDDLSWLPAPGGEGDEDYGYGQFFEGIGALLVGRRTYDVACGFEGDWPYGDRAVLVASRRGITPKVDTVRAVSGSIGSLVAAAREAAGGKDVYLDGGELIRQAIDADLVDEITVTFVPTILGRGVPLFAGAASRHAFELVASAAFSTGLVQLTFRPRRALV